MNVSIGGTLIQGVAFSCSLCGKMINYQIDPWAIKTDIVQEVVSELKPFFNG